MEFVGYAFIKINVTTISNKKTVSDTAKTVPSNNDYAYSRRSIPIYTQQWTIIAAVFSILTESRGIFSYKARKSERRILQLVDGLIVNGHNKVESANFQVSAA